MILFLRQPGDCLLKRTSSPRVVTMAGAGTLEVKVLRASNLRASASGDAQTPMVKLRVIRPGGDTGAEASTKTFEKDSRNFEPSWADETFTLAVEDDCRLECTLWDKDDATPQNFLGEIVLNLSQLVPYNQQVLEIMQGTTHEATEGKKASGLLTLMSKLAIPLQTQVGAVPPSYTLAAGDRVWAQVICSGETEFSSSLQRGATIERVNEDGTFAVDYDDYSGDWTKKVPAERVRAQACKELVEAITQGDAEMVKRLLDARCGGRSPVDNHIVDTEAVDERGKTAIIFAAEKGQAGVVEVLLQFNANVTATDEVICFPNVRLRVCVTT